MPMKVPTVTAEATMMLIIACPLHIKVLRMAICNPHSEKKSGEAHSDAKGRLPGGEDGCVFF
jgi:hypothetical protein